MNVIEKLKKRNQILSISFSLVIDIILMIAYTFIYIVQHQIWCIFFAVAFLIIAFLNAKKIYKILHVEETKE